MHFPENTPQWQFGEKPNFLATLVTAGLKTATCSGRIFYELEQEPLPEAGRIDIVLDSQNQPVVAIELESVEICRFGEISSEFALAEGEGSLAQWQADHRQFFNEMCKTLPESHRLQAGIDDDFELVCERFRCVHYFPKSYQQWLAFAEQTLAENRQNDPYLVPKTDASWLLQAVTKRSKSAIFAFSETVLTDAELQQLAELLARRAKGEPMAYILGEKAFWSLNLKVSPATLIPRPDTERLVEVALDWACQRLASQEKVRILDLGTGTGAIALALAKELGEKAEVLGVDLKAEAVLLAEENRRRNGIQNARFVQSDWFSQVAGKFDLIVSNPPYIDAEDENLRQGDVRFEPLSALVADNQGLSDLQKIIENAPLHLTQNGALFLEHGWQQAAAIQQLFQQNQWVKFETFQDYGGNDRVTKAEWKENE